MQIPQRKAFNVCGWSVQRAWGRTVIGLFEQSKEEIVARLEQRRGVLYEKKLENENGARRPDYIGLHRVIQGFLLLPERNSEPLKIF